MFIFLYALSWPSSIPRQVYITSQDARIAKDSYEKRFFKVHDEGQFKLQYYDDRDCMHSLMKTKIGQNLIHIFNGSKTDLKADIWRAYMLYLHGGVYADIDTDFVTPLDSFVHDDTSFLTSDSLEKTMLNPIVIVSEPKMPILRKTLHNMKLSWNTGRRQLWQLSICVHCYAAYRSECGAKATRKVCAGKVHVLAYESKDRRSTILHNQTILRNHVRSSH